VASLTITVAACHSATLPSDHSGVVSDTMSATTTLQMAANGRLVIAAPIRKELGLDSEPVVFLAEVVSGRLVLTPADVVPRTEREWLTSPEVTALLDQADEHLAAGEVAPLTRADVARLRRERAGKSSQRA